MARILVGSYAVRFPLGGYLSWVLQWLVGFKRLGHDVYFVEKSGWENACYDPGKDEMSDDCTYGMAALNRLLTRFGLQGKWVFVDYAGRYFGLSRTHVQAVFDSADLFVDMGTHGTWLEEAAHTGLRVLIDGDPGHMQLKALADEEDLDGYDYYYSVGRNLGNPDCVVPTLGKEWRPIFDPVVSSLFPVHRANPHAPFTTMMFWQSYQSVEVNGMTYGQKDVEFEKFITLPRLTPTPFEITLGGSNAPEARLRTAGWQIASPRQVTATFDTFAEYIAASRGEFSVNKNIYVATNSGFFSERSAVYLASGRPVVMQDTGFSAHLPCGSGLFAVHNVEEAAAAVEMINADYTQHSRCAHEIACEYLDTSRVLTTFLDELGIPARSVQG